MSPRPHPLMLTAPSSLPSVTAVSDQAPAQEPDTRTDLWADASVLSERLQQCLKQGEIASLQWDDLVLLRSCLREADEELIPPDVHVSLREFQRALSEVVSQARNQLAWLHMDGDRLKTLAGLLQDVLATQGRMECGRWHTYCGHGWEPRPEMMQKLGSWMCGGGVARHAHRSEVGRQVLHQAAGFINECQFGSDDQLLELPRGPVLHDLMDSNTRAHVTLRGTEEEVALLTDGLSALPLRTWRLHAWETLGIVLLWRPASLRTLDLTMLKNAERPEAFELIRRAADELPNLSVVKLPAGLSSNVLGPAWELSSASDGQVLARVDRPDGLALLDEAVQTWQGRIMSTRLGIRHKASQPDAACLLAFAARLGRGPCSAQTGRQLEEMMDRANVSDHDLHAYAEQIRMAQEGMAPERLMQSMHRRLGAQVKPTAVLLQAESVPTPSRTPSEVLSPSLTDEAASESSAAYASGFETDVSELDSPAASRVAHPLEQWLHSSAASSGPRFEWPAARFLQDSDGELSAADSLVSQTSETSTLAGTVSTDSLVWAAAPVLRASARARSAAASPGFEPSAASTPSAGAAPPGFPASRPFAESTASSDYAPASRAVRRAVQRPAVPPPRPPLLSLPSRPQLQPRPQLPPRPPLPTRPPASAAGRSPDSGPT